MRELDITQLGVNATTEDNLENAIYLASDQDEGTWLNRDGKRVAAIVPGEVLERYLHFLDSVTELKTKMANPAMKTRVAAWLEEQPDGLF